MDDNRLAVLRGEVEDLLNILDKFWEIVQAAKLARDTEFGDQSNNAILEAALDALEED
jgi:hypothetical protein